MILLLVALVTLAVTVLAASASAWTSEDIVPSEGEYRSAYVYYWTSEYLRDENIFPAYTSIPISGNYRGYMSYSVDHLDDRTHVASASLTVIAATSGSCTLNVKVMDRELHELDPGIAFSSIWRATSAGTISISTGGFVRTYTLDITGAALDAVRDVVADDDDYLVLGFHPTSSGWVDLYAHFTDLSGTYYSTLTLEYDDEAPEVPTPDPMPAYTTGDHITVSWSTVSDNPSGGNRGEVGYQVGVHLPDATAGDPFISSPWIDTTSWNVTGLAEAVDYTFRVRARDGSGFVSDWSLPVNTTVDNSPPTTPLLYPEPPYTNGTENTIMWWPCLDAGVGNVSYEYQWSIVAGFHINIRHFTNETFVNVTDLREWTYYYRVRSLDGLGHTSPWSPVERSTQDASPPTVPVMMDEPEFVPMTWNLFEWHPASDLGVGVKWYIIQLSTSPDFGSISGEFIANWTSMEFQGLVDGLTYYTRVKAVDHFGHESDWSEPVHSTQDASPPSAPFIHTLPEYLPAGPVTISWDPAVDGGVGVARYELYWDRPGPGMPPVYLVRVIGQSYTLTHLGEGNWTFNVRAVDAFGHPGPWSSVNTTIDGTPPTKPVLEPLPGVVGDTKVALRWSSSVDNGSGIDYYRVFWQHSNSEGQLQWTDVGRNDITIAGLDDESHYWIWVTAVDRVGLAGTSEKYRVEVNATPPRPPIISRGWEVWRTVEVAWTPVFGAAYGPHEYMVLYSYGPTPPDPAMHKDIWHKTEWTNRTGRVFEDLKEWMTYWFCVVARDTRGLVSEPSEVISMRLDNTTPVVVLSAPKNGERISGVVRVHGMFEDLNPSEVSVQYRPRGGRNWEYILDNTSVSERYFSALWVTTDLPDGEYTLRAIVEDAVQYQGTAEVNITINNAMLVISHNDIVVSDPTPERGELVDIFFYVTNLGDGFAENLLIEIYDNDELVWRDDNENVGPRSVRQIIYTMTVNGTHRVVIKIRSDLLYPNETMAGVDIRAVEEKVQEDDGMDTGLLLGIVALVLAVIALLLTVTRSLGRSPDLRDERDSEGADVWEEARDEGR